MLPRQMWARIVRHGDHRPCCTSFIGARPLGADRNEDFTIIGGGVFERVHLKIIESLGFNIGTAGLRPFCRNALRLHRTAAVVRGVRGAGTPQTGFCLLSAAASVSKTLKTAPAPALRP